MDEYIHRFLKIPWEKSHFSKLIHKCNAILNKNPERIFIEFDKLI